MSSSVFTDQYQVFLELLVKARQASGLTQRELAEKLGKSHSYVAKCETGYSRMDIVQIWDYLNAVNTPFTDFMNDYERILRVKKNLNSTEI